MRVHGRERVYMSNGSCRPGPARVQLDPTRGASVQAWHNSVSCRARPARGLADAV
jgi:hypothetical protein